MKHIKSKLTAIFSCISLSVVPAVQAIIIGPGINIGTDVTVNDKQTGGYWGTDTRLAYPYGQSSGTKESVYEDQEVTNNALQSELYDLEGVFYDKGIKRLSIIGQYNFRDGVYDSNWNQTFTSGDMFVDVAAYGTDGSNSLNYAIHFDWNAATTWTINQSTVSYSIYKIGNSSAFSDVYFSQFSASNPFRYVAGPNETALGTGTAIVQRALGSVTSDVNNYTFQGSSERFGLIIGTGNTGISSILTDYSIYNGGAPLQEFGAKFTMYCGNDEILAFVADANSKVPDSASTNILIGIGILGLGFAVRRK